MTGTHLSASGHPNPENEHWPENDGSDWLNHAFNDYSSDASAFSYFHCLNGAHDDSCVGAHHHFPAHPQADLNDFLGNDAQPTKVQSSQAAPSRNRHSISTLPSGNGGSASFLDDEASFSFQNPGNLMGFGPVMSGPVNPLLGAGEGDGEQADDGVDEDDDCASRCSSDCEADCQSQCGADIPGEVCHDADCVPDCHDEQCNPATRCTDSHCTSPERETSPSAERAAELLESLHGMSMPTLHQSHHGLGTTNGFQLFPPQTPSYQPQTGFIPTLADPPVMSSHDLSASQPFGNMGDFFPAFDTNMDPMVVSHLMQHHGPNASEQCISPCLLNNYGLHMSPCRLPQWPHAHPNQDTFCQPPADLQLANAECGQTFQSPSQFLSHFNEFHRPALAQNFFSAQFPQQYAAPASRGFGLVTPGLPTTEPQNKRRRKASASQRASPIVADPNGHAASSATSSTLPTPTSGTQAINSPNTSNDDTSPHLIHQCLWQHSDTDPICAQIFDSDEALQNHCRDVHLKHLDKVDGGFQCRWHDCSRRRSPNDKFAQRSKLERHLQTHTGYKPVKCPICGQSLSAKQSLEQHMRIHTGETPWHCDFGDCKAKFKQQSALTMHKRTHTGEKPLICDVCEMCFSESSNLSKHKKIHAVRGQHVCPTCNKDFRRLDQCRRHMKTHGHGLGSMSPGTGTASASPAPSSLFSTPDRVIDGRVNKQKQ